MEITEIIRAAGGVSKIAQKVHRHHTSVMGWRRVPVEHARDVAEMAKLPLHAIRPDVWEPPASQPSEAVA